MKKHIVIYLLSTIVAAVTVINGYRLYTMKDITTPEGLAINADAALDKEKPLKITKKDLVELWPKEVVPFFEYESLTNGTSKAPTVEFFDGYDARQHFHVMGYTMPLGDLRAVHLNDRYTNKVSVKYENIGALTTLVHEIAHLQKGDFGYADEAEKNAQLATLEVLAAMANSGNKYAKQALLDELRDIALGVVLDKDITNNDLEHYRKFAKSLGINADRQIRQWNRMGLAGVQESLKKYCVSVYLDMQDFEFVAKADGDVTPRVFVMDDLREFLSKL